MRFFAKFFAIILLVAVSIGATYLATTNENIQNKFGYETEQLQIINEQRDSLVSLQEELTAKNTALVSANEQKTVANTQVETLTRDKNTLLNQLATVTAEKDRINSLLETANENNALNETEIEELTESVNFLHEVEHDLNEIINAMQIDIDNQLMVIAELEAQISELESSSGSTALSLVVNDYTKPVVENERMPLLFHIVERDGASYVYFGIDPSMGYGFAPFVEFPCLIEDGLITINCDPGTLELCNEKFGISNLYLIPNDMSVIEAFNSVTQLKIDMYSQGTSLGRGNVKLCVVDSISDPTEVITLIPNIWAYCLPN